MNTRDLIDAIDSGNAIEIEDAFNSIMAEKISFRLEDIKQDVAKNMFSGMNAQNEVSSENNEG